jgi:hypothetical protein
MSPDKISRIVDYQGFKPEFGETLQATAWQRRRTVSQAMLKVEWTVTARAVNRRSLIANATCSALLWRNSPMLYMFVLAVQCTSFTKL